MYQTKYANSLNCWQFILIETTFNLKHVQNLFNTLYENNLFSNNYMKQK